MKIVIVGGGWAGCAASAQAAKSGASVTLLERTDSLLGTGLVGGIIRNNGRFTATEEMAAMGGDDMFRAMDICLRHKCISFPGHQHADLYDISKTPMAVEQRLLQLGVSICRQARVTGADMSGDNTTVLSVRDDRGNRYEADGFIDATGTAGPMNNCRQYGNGCAMCVLRCPSFGGRVSLCGLTGLTELKAAGDEGSYGAMSGSCKLFKESLSPGIVKALDDNGVVIIPLPRELMENHLSIKACQQYAINEFAENIILLDTGHAKMMTPYYPLEKLHKIPGFECARYEDPYAGGKGNSMRYFAMCRRSNSLKADQRTNLFCAGEKAGLLVGHTEAIVTGVLAGHNMVQFLSGRPLLEFPRELAVGEAIAWVKEQMETPEGLREKYTFSGSCLFRRMKDLGLYSIDTESIHKKVEDLGLAGIFSYL